MTGWNVVFDPLLPWAALGVVAALGVALLAALAYARAPGLPLRALALGLIVASLAGPSFRDEQRVPMKDIAVAVVDRSHSQRLGNRTAETDAALADLKAQIAQLPNTELKVVEVTSGLGTDDNGTLAFAALNRGLGEIPQNRFAGAVMITDGQVHDVPEDTAKSGLPGPLHAIITGNPKERDRRVVFDLAPRFGIVGKEQTFKFHVDDTNGDGGPIGVTVTYGKAETATMSVQPGEVVEFPVTIDHGGQNITQVQVELAEGEISQQNNTAVALTEGVRDRLRVLLISGQPHAGERTWRNLLKADASVDLVHFTILRPPEKQDGTPIKELALIAFPTRELFVEKLDEFDLVIFDRYRRQAVLPMAYLANVVDYVNNGGAVLISSGPDFAADDGLYTTPLADILNAPPSGTITDGGFKPKITALGRRHPVTAGLPGGDGDTPSWGRWFRVVDAADTKGEVVMSGPGEKPLLVLSRSGEGRVAQLLSDQGWLWARGFEGGGPITELLRRMAHWLMKEPDLEEEALRGAQKGNRIIIQRRTMADTAEPVTVTMPSGTTATVKLTAQAPGLWQGSLEIAEPGLYRLNDGKLESFAAAGNADAREATDVVATAARLKPATDALGGSIAWSETGRPRFVKVTPGHAMSGSGWMGLRDNQAYNVTAVTEVPLFATLLSLGALLLVVTGMWYREGR